VSAATVERLRELLAELNRRADLTEGERRRVHEIARWLDTMETKEAGAVFSGMVMGSLATFALLGMDSDQLSHDLTSARGEDKIDPTALKIACASWRGCTYRLSVETTRPIYLTMRGARRLLGLVKNSIRHLESMNRTGHRGRPKRKK